MPRISLGTVYRNLEQLVEAGLIQKLEGGGGQARFDGNIEPHQHVRCIYCGRVADVQGGPTVPAVHNITSAGGYEIISCHLEFIGVCPDCRRELADDGRSDRPDSTGRLSQDG